jgi:Xaa-Pro dipeptidase
MANPDRDTAALYAQHLAALSARFSHALAAANFDRVAIFAGDLQLRARDDSAYPFRVDPYFALWLPVHHAAGSVLCFEPGRKPLLIYRQDDDFWHAPPRDPEGFWPAHFEIVIARSADATSKCLQAWQSGCAAIGEAAVLSGAFERCNDKTLIAQLDYQRACKTPYEVSCMATANRIAAAGHRAAGSAFGDGRSEFELDRIYCAATEQRETELPYSNIVALNEHAAVLHYQHLERRAPRRANSFLIDAGATSQGYAADVTRTWQQGNTAFADLIRAMEGVQQMLCAEVAADTDFVALNERAHALLAGVLVEHGIVKCSADDAYSGGLTRTFLPHGLGHLLGLQVHDVGGWQHSPDGDICEPPESHPFLRLTRKLEPGFALTIEPGLYFIESLLAKLDSKQAAKLNRKLIDSLMAYGGIRIEDNLVVESTHSLNLTRDAFASIETGSAQREPI